MYWHAYILFALLLCFSINCYAFVVSFNARVYQTISFVDLLCLYFLYYIGDLAF